MEPRLSLVTLGVRDLSRARRFYEALGWRGQEVEETVFFQAGGLALVLWGRDLLAADCGMRDTLDRVGFGGIALAHDVRTRAQVDEALSDAQRAGAVVTRPAADTPYGGYAGVFTDPDGHPWEVSCNPGLPMAEDGSITVPTFG